MVANEPARRHLLERLTVTIGQQAAETLMDEMGSLGRDQLATGVDVHDLGARMDHEFDKLRSEMSVGFAEVRTEIASMGSSFSLDMAKQTRQLGIWMLASQTTLAGIVFAAAQL